MFYDRFVALCAQRGESPSRAAQNAGVSKAAVSRWKQNPDAFPSGAAVGKLSAYFGVSVTELLGEAPEEQSAQTPEKADRHTVPAPLNPNSPAAQGKTLAQAQAEENREDALPENVYDRFARISRLHGMSPSRAAQNAGVSKATVSKWKQDPDTWPSGAVLAKLSAYFGITTSELLGEQEPESPQTSDEAIKFALFGGSEDITPEMFDEVRSFAAFVKEREAKKRGKE